MDSLSEEEKATFKRATERRRENGIRLKRITLLAQPSQVEGFTELFDSWVIRWGKSRALDELIRIMSIVEARIRDKENAPPPNKKG